MYKSVSEIVGTDIEVVKKFIKENADNIVDCNYDENGIEQLNIDELIQGKTLNQIDSLIVNHITPRENEKTIWDEGLLTLSYALTQKTALSDYLKKWGFTFSFDQKQITMYKNDVIVEVKHKLGTNLDMRLGGEKTLNDYNINGYLFVNEFEEDAISGWLGSPEFLKSLSIYYSNHNIANDYCDKCQNYYVSFEVPIDKVDLEGFSDDIDSMRKTEILLRYVINALSYAAMERKPFLPMYNPIIFLKRDYNVPKENIRKIWDFQRKGVKWIPVESSSITNSLFLKIKVSVITIRFILNKKSELLRRLRFFYNVVATRVWKLGTYPGSPGNQNYSTYQIKQKEQHKTQFCMPLSPAKSRHEGNWLHFNSESGGELPHGRLILLSKTMILLGKQSFLSVHLLVVV